MLIVVIAVETGQGSAEKTCLGRHFSCTAILPLPTLTFTFCFKCNAIFITVIASLTHNLNRRVRDASLVNCKRQELKEKRSRDKIKD